MPRCVKLLYVKSQRVCILLLPAKRKANEVVFWLTRSLSAALPYSKIYAHFGDGERRKDKPLRLRNVSKEYLTKRFTITIPTNIQELNNISVQYLNAVFKMTAPYRNDRGLAFPIV